MRLFKKKPGGTKFGNWFRKFTAQIVPLGLGTLINEFINPVPGENASNNDASFTTGMDSIER